eukprot:TRINITY_DN4170_c0_g1_i5.p1 TRINITY_DN4170_c0_g1~~TRINITY_DN4170_c0_g1_i5.p1  ORF type:complete len:209 (+),score=46.43 TRINITY_DN4170_c0_g1_i5:429-1055(+)
MIGDRSVYSYCESVSATYNQHVITLLVEALDAALRRNVSAYDRRGAPQKQSNPVLSMEDVFPVATHMQFMHRMHFKSTTCAQDTANYIHRATITIAERPYKKPPPDLPFSEADVKPRRELGSLQAVWTAQLELLPKLGSTAAQAITREYPTVRRLCDAYAHTANDDASARLVARLPCAQLREARTVGPVASSRLYRVFTSLDPDEKLT